MTLDITPRVFFVVILIATLGQIVGFLYIPSFTSIANEFFIPASQVQFTFSIYMLSYGLSHLFYGPLSDSTGRKKPLIAGIAFCALGCLVCIYASDISQLLLGRFIQGAGVGVCGAVGRSVTRDLAQGNRLAHLSSLIGMSAAMMLAFAPVIGGYIQEYFGWRYNFVFLFFFIAIVLLLIGFVLPETHEHARRNDFSIKNSLASYRRLLQSKIFMGYTLSSCFAYAGFVAFITASPIIFVGTLKFSTVEFGWLAFAIGASFFAAAYVNSKLVLQHGIRKMLLVGIIGMLITATLLLITPNTSHQFVNIAFLLLFVVSAGFAFVNAFAGAMHYFADIAGAAGALFGSLQTLSGAMSAGLISIFYANTTHRLTLFLLFFAFVTCACYFALIPKDLEDNDQRLSENNI